VLHKHLLVWISLIGTARVPFFESRVSTAPIMPNLIIAWIDMSLSLVVGVPGFVDGAPANRKDEGGLES